MSEPVLAIGPANYAGQAHEWAKAVRTNLPVRAWSFTRGPIRRGGFAFPADVTIPAPAFHTSLARGIRTRRLLAGVTHAAIDGYQPWFRLFRSRVFGRDIRSLMADGLDVALIAHGTDIRDPGLHRDRLKWSYFNEGSDEWREELTRNSAKNRAHARDLGLPLFVSTPDLLLDLPEATWLPVCTDLSEWSPVAPAMTRPVPRVLHLPSRRNPPIKGTQYVDPIMRRLDAEGVIEYVAPTGAVSHESMPDLIRGCDIVVDQVLSGFYGVAAIEAMAAGRVLVGSLADDVAALMPEAPKIIHADPDTLEAVVRGILADRETAREGARENLEFVHRWHDGRRSAAAMAGFLGVSPRRSVD